MREEIKNSIDEVFNNTDTSINDIYNNNDVEVNKLVENQNNKVVEDINYRKELLDKLDQIKDLGFNIEYNDKMTNEELEDIINSVQF